MDDVRYAIRALAKNPSFSLTVIGVLALGIGLNAAVFTMLKSMALSPVAGVEHSSQLGAIGAAIGVAAALVLTRFLQDALFGVSATDAISFVAALAVVLGGVALATLVPASRAARTDPLRALRHQ